MTSQTEPDTADPAKPSSLRGRLMLLGLVVLVVILFFSAGGAGWLTLENLQARRFELLAYAEAQFWTLFVIAGAVYVVATAFSLPGATLLSLLSGFLFGRIAGTILIVVGATIGATLLLIAARYLFADAARRRLEKNPRAARLLTGFNRGAFNYLLFLRLVPVFPFWLVNLASAVTRIPVRTYVLGTAIGIVPGAFVFANLGRSLGTVDSLEGLVSGEVLIALGLLGVLSLVPVFFTRRKDDVRSNNPR